MLCGTTDSRSTVRRAITAVDRCEVQVPSCAGVVWLREPSRTQLLSNRPFVHWGQLLDLTVLFADNSLATRCERKLRVQKLSGAYLGERNA